MRTCPAPWGMSAQEHTFTFCQIFFISGGNYTLITCIQYTTMVTHSECEISQSWRTQFSSHDVLNLNRAVMPPPLPLYDMRVSVLQGELTEYEPILKYKLRALSDWGMQNVKFHHSVNTTPFRRTQTKSFMVYLHD